MNAARRLNAKPFLVLLSLVVAAFVATGAEAEKSKPKPAATTTGAFEITDYSFSAANIDGSPGPLVSLDGVLRLVSQALLSGNGVPVGFTLHANLSDAFATSSDGSESFVAVGAPEGIPAECLESEPCPPPFWTLTFRLIPEGEALRPSLVFDLTVNTQYDAAGTLVNACVAGQEGCEVIVFVP